MNDRDLQTVTIGEPTRVDGPVALVDHDPEWARAYAREKRTIRAVLGERALVLEHVGSTSVPGLAAKPIVDIVLGVADPADEPAYVPGLERAGYVLRIREPRWYQHRMLKRADPEVNLHVFARDCPELGVMVRFRNHLREHPEDRELYERTKRELARREWRYVQDYADAKSAVVADIMSRVN